MHAILIQHLAACTPSQGPCTGGTSQFWSTSLGGLVGALMAFLGVIVILGAFTKAAFDILSGSKQKPFKLLIGALVVGIFLIQPQLIGDLISLVAGWVKDIINSIGQVSNNSNNATGVGTGTGTGLNGGG